MGTDRSTPDPYFTNRFELPARAVRSALDAIEAMAPDASADEIFRAGRRFSAACGFMARELHQADEATRFRQGLPDRPLQETPAVRMTPPAASRSVDTPIAPLIASNDGPTEIMS